VPDLYAFAQHGVVFTGGTGKLAEHGGADPQDRNVPIVVSGAGAHAHAPRAGSVETTQIAPTILMLLGLDPDQLQAVTIEHTRPLPLS
jgi:arylsulfatase A-like enzyme